MQSPQHEFRREQLFAPVRRMRRRIKDIDEALREIKAQFTWMCVKLGLETSVSRTTGRVEILIEGRIVSLPKRLAALMGALAVMPGTWRTLEELAARLDSNGKGGKPDAIPQAICRLRKELRPAGLDRRIESRRGYGYRWNSHDKG